MLVRLGNVRDGDRIPMGLMIRKDYALAMIGALGNALFNLEL